ncbi:MAG: LysM peptidoglycan-binding domain-containing protein [Anaeroplasmataceae bacterium]|nr:LysM peptidoglycan-binding domain-containing protein [Anaeroplasmataceae bacterium]
MLEHIVKNGERIQEILEMYHLELDEIQSVNQHITDFYNLISGMKIKIPVISKEVEQILENTESFVEHYFPKINEIIEEKEEMIQEEKPVPVEQKVSKPQERDIPFKGIPYPGILPPKHPYKKSN